MSLLKIWPGTPEKCFSLKFTARNLSKFVEGEKQFSDEEVWFDFPWKLMIVKLDELFQLFLICGQNELDVRKWSISTKFKFKMVTNNGRHFVKDGELQVDTLSQEYLFSFFDEEFMKRELLTVESAKIEVQLKILEMEEEPSKTKEFWLTFVVQNLARFEEEETQFSNVEERFEIPWRIFVQKRDRFFGCYLQYEKELYYPVNWNVEGQCTFSLMSVGRKVYSNFYELDFEEPGMKGDSKFIRWDDLESHHSVHDSVTVVARVQITISTIGKGPLTKKFVVSQLFSNLSSMRDRGYQFHNYERRFNIPWRIELQRKSGFLAIHLHCRKKTCDTTTWTIEIKFWLKLVSINGKCLMRQIETTFQGDERRSVAKFIRWDDMMTDYAINDSVVIEAHVEILSIEEEETDEAQSVDELEASVSDLVLREDKYYGRSFFLGFTAINVSKFQNGEKQWSRTEQRYGIPWRIRIRKTLGYLEILLFCCEELCIAPKRLMEAECVFKLVSTNGFDMKQTSKLFFVKSGGRGISQFIHWNDMEEEYAVNDSVVVEAHVKINRIQELSSGTSPTGRSFILSHTVRNASSVREGNTIFSESEEWNYVSWSMSIKNNNGFVELLLHCENEIYGDETWMLQTRYQLSLVGADEKRITEYCEHTFDKPDSHGEPKVMRWNDMLTQYAVGDGVKIEALVFVQEIDPSQQNWFLVSHTLKNLLNVRDEENHFSKTEKHFDIPWRISLKKEQMCILIYLHCDKQLCNNEHWSIQTEVQLILVSDNGRTASDSVTHIFERPEGICWTKCIRWEEMERDFVVDDSVRIEARVNIVHFEEDEEVRDVNAIINDE